MKMLSALLLFLAVQFIPSAPGQLTVDAQYNQLLPNCAKGAGVDADGSGYVDGPCPGADHFSAQGTGKAVQLEACDRVGTMVIFSDPVADGGSAVRRANATPQLSGQLRCVVTLTAGTYTVKLRLRAPNAGKTSVWMSTSPLLVLPPPIDATTKTDTSPLQSGSFQWAPLLQTIVVAGTVTKEIYFDLEDSLEGDCAYIDTNANAKPACPTGTVPPVADYRVLDVGGGALPTADGTEDAIWANADVVSAKQGAFNNGTTATFFTKMLWKSSTNKFCVLQKIVAPGLQTIVTTDDDVVNASYDTGLTIDARFNQVQVFDSNTYRIIFNGDTTPRLTDANWPSAVFSSAFNLANVTRGRSYSAGVMIIELCADLPVGVSVGQLSLMDFQSQELIAGMLKYKTAFSPRDESRDIDAWGIVEWSASAPAADSTPPAVSAPSFANITSSSITVSATCTDSGKGCTAGYFQFGTNSGAYTSSQNASVTGTNPYTIGPTQLTGLSPGTPYYVQACGIDGAGLTTCGTEDNRSTTGGGAGTDLIIVNSGGCVGASCVCSEAVPCDPSILTTNKVQPGVVFALKDGTYDTGGIDINCALSGGPQPGNNKQPVTIKSQNERKGYLHFTSSSNVPTLQIQNCAHYVIQGLRIDGNPSQSNLTGLLFVNRSTNVTVRRNLVHDCKGGPGYNTHCIGVALTTGGLYEENEMYNLIRHGIYFDHSTDITVRRNYCNSRDWDHAQTVCVNPYPGARITIENNIGENLALVANIDAAGYTAYIPSDDNKILGNIHLNGSTGVGMSCRSSDHPNGTIMSDNVNVSNRNFYGEERGFQILGGVNTVFSKNTAFHTATQPIAGLFTNAEGDVSVGCTASPSASTATLQNNLMASINGSTALGFNLAIATWSSQGARATSNYATPFSPGAADGRWNFTASTFAMTATQKACPAFILSVAKGGNSELYHAGNGGQSIGADIDYPYIDGVKQTSGPKFWVWDGTAGQVNPLFVGAPVAGVNDSSMDSLVNFGTRFHANCPLASFP